MINLELRRAIYKAFGLRPDGLQRLIIDIKPGENPVVYAQMVSTGGTVEEVIESIQFSGFDMHKVEILDAIPTVDNALTTVDTGEYVYGERVDYSNCTNDVHCKVKSMHVHTSV